MIGLALAVTLAALPSASQRYRVEIAGERVGFAALDLACGAEECRLRWESALRAPEPSGGGELTRLIEGRTAPDGRARWVRASMGEGSSSREVEAQGGPLPASLAALALSPAAEGERRCVEVREEASGEEGRACATRRGEWLEGDVLGVALRFRARPGEAPEEVVVPEQRVRFVADPAAALPAEGPRLLGVAVPLAPGASKDAPLRFCGRAQEPSPPPAPAGLPRAFPEGASCREKTARYLARAADAGLPGRHVVGVAWDGEGFAWHEWAELYAGGAWVPVDPSFRQLPAKGPRFAVARYRGADPSARLAAGRAILGCWGTASVAAAR